MVFIFICSLYHSFPLNLNQTHVPRNFTTSIYVYDSPVIDLVTRQILQCLRSRAEELVLHERAQHMFKSVWLHRLFLNSPYRTLTPSSKQCLYFIPCYATLSSIAGRCHNTTHIERMKQLSLDPQLIHNVESNVPHLITGDGPHLTRSNLINTPFLRLFQNRTNLVLAESEMWGGTRGGTKRGIDQRVFIPHVPTPYLSLNSNVPSKHRHIHVFFVGTLNRSQTRQRWSKALQKGNWSKLIFWKNNLSQFKYSSVIRKSKFCLVLKGHTCTSRRLYEAIAAGCVPVLDTCLTGISHLFTINTTKPWYVRFKVKQIDSLFKLKYTDFETGKKIQNQLLYGKQDSITWPWVGSATYSSFDNLLLKQFSDLNL